MKLHRIIVRMVMTKGFFRVLIKILAVEKCHGIFHRQLCKRTAQDKNPAGDLCRPSPSGGIATYIMGGD